MASTPSLATILRTTSIMPLYLPAEALSCRRILTSSKGTTTNDSVAPAVAPVRTESAWVCSDTPKALRYILPHSSLAANFVALGVVKLRSVHVGFAWIAYRLGASIRMGAEMPRYSLENLVVSISARFGLSSITRGAHPSCLMIFLKQSTMPLYRSLPTAVWSWSCL